jgi:hypothetical protein
VCEVDHTHHRQDRRGEKCDGVEPGWCRVHLLSLCGIIIDTQTSLISYTHMQIKVNNHIIVKKNIIFVLGGGKCFGSLINITISIMKIVVQRVFEAWVKVGGV